MIDRQKSAYGGGNTGPPKFLHAEQVTYSATPISSQSSAYALAPPYSPRLICIKGLSQRQKPAPPVKLERTPEPDWQEIPYVEEGAYTRGFAVAQDVLDAYVDTRGPVAREARVYSHQQGAYKHEGSSFHHTQFVKQEPGTELYPQGPKQTYKYPQGHAIAPNVLDAHVDIGGPVAREARVYPSQLGAYKYPGPISYNNQLNKQEPGTETYPQRPEQADGYPQSAPDVLGTHIDARGSVAREAGVYPYQLGAHKQEGPGACNTQGNKQEPATKTYPESREQPEAYPQGHAVAPDVCDTHHAAKDPKAYRQPRTQGRDTPYILLYIPLIYS